MPAVLFFKTTLQSLDATLDPAGSDFCYVCQTLSAPTALLAGDVSVAIQHFYTTVPTGGTNAYQSYLSQSLDHTRGIGWQAYDITGHLSGTPHGSPINSGTYTLSAVSATAGPMPEGAAAVLSFRGNYGTDVEFVRDPVTHKVTSRPRARHRGRMYLGPLAANAFSQDTTTKRTKISSFFQTDLLSAIQAASTITDSGSNKWHLSHWSKKNASTEDLVLAWMDDRPDYQRRRSDQSMSRATQTITYT